MVKVKLCITKGKKEIVSKSQHSEEVKTIPDRCVLPKVRKKL